MFMPDLTVTIIFHHEGPLAIPALSSMHDLVRCAEQAGISIEARAVLDRPDALTTRIVEARGGWLHGVDVVSVGDLGLARNAGVKAAAGNYLAFLDGDDLWGSEWLARAYRAATTSPDRAIWHPQTLYYFTEADFNNHSVTRAPNPGTRSFFMHHSCSEHGFDPNVLFLNNIWTANVLSHRSVHEQFPYEPVNRAQGFGVEDWSWNIHTVWAGIHHRIVPDTVHLIRVKEAGSLGQQNSAEGLLSHLPPAAKPRLGASI